MTMDGEVGNVWSLRLLDVMVTDSCYYESQYNPNIYPIIL